MNQKSKMHLNGLYTIVLAVGRVRPLPLLHCSIVVA